jgi:hypothetical protein
LALFNLVVVGPFNYLEARFSQLANGTERLAMSKLALVSDPSTASRM